MQALETAGMAAMLFGLGLQIVTICSWIYMTPRKDLGKRRPPVIIGLGLGAMLGIAGLAAQVISGGQRYTWEMGASVFACATLSLVGLTLECEGPDHEMRWLTMGFGSLTTGGAIVCLILGILSGEFSRGLS